MALVSGIASHMLYNLLALPFRMNLLNNKQHAPLKQTASHPHITRTGGIHVKRSTHTRF
jgi:hypothetical protein